MPPQTPTRVYLATDHRIRHVTDPLARAGLERWILDVVAANPRFTVDQGVVAACQLVQRWGIDIVSDDARRGLLVRPVLHTEAEWLARGKLVHRGARPVQLPGSLGGRVDCFLAGDVAPAPWAGDDGRWPVVDALAQTPFRHRRPHPLAPRHEEFREVLNHYERTLLGHVWAIGAVVEWDPELDYETLGWIRNGRPDRRWPPRPDGSVDEAYFRLGINPDPGEAHVMTVIVGLLAEIMALTVLGRWRGTPVGADDGVEEPDVLELGLITHLTARRLGLREEVRDRTVRTYLRGEVVEPAPDTLRWNLVFEAAELLEDLLRGDSMFHRSAVGE